MASPITEGLNAQQLEAVTAPEGPVLVLAGPGSGKTRVLTHRIAWLVQERGVPPHRIMAMTFTNKAAREMQGRVEKLLGGSLKGIWLGTFHAICARILRQEAEKYLPISRDYVIFDTSDQRALMKIVIVEDLQLDDKRYKPDRILGAISQAKNDLITPEDFRSATYFDEIVKRAYVYYQERLATNNAVDFDDLLMHTALLFGQHADLLARYQNRFDHVLVDEFQDTNGAQYEMVRRLAEKHRTLFCVGDEDQSIYRWRGADYRNMLRLHEDFPGLVTVLLEQNYRSTQNILDAAQAVIDRNPQRTPKKLFTDQEGGPLILLHEAHNEQFEAQFVVDQIVELVVTKQAEPGQIAVMYRTNAQSRVIEDAFVRASIPYRLVGATRFYTRREIKDIIAYLRVIHNPDDAVSLNRIINTPSRGIGDKSVEALARWAQQIGTSPAGALFKLAENPEAGPLDGRTRGPLLKFAEMLENWRAARDQKTVANLLKLVLEDIRYFEYINDGTLQGEERQANVMELVNLAAEYDELPLATFLEEVALVSEVDNLAETVDAPTLLTLHAAKGLEFDVVFMVGLEEGMLPHERSRDDPEQMAEERRLMYVGMTRARKLLYLINTFRRSVYGDSTVNLRSRFVDDIPDALIAPAYTAALSGAMRTARPPRIGGEVHVDRQGVTYKAGQRVSHPKFGEGIVIESRAAGDDEEVSVAFEEVGIKRLLGSFANLTVLEG